MRRFAITLILATSFSAAAATRPAIPVLTIADEGGAALALETIKVRTIVRGHLARTELDLTYRNELTRDLSGDFIFPLPEGAEVSDIGLYFDGRLRHGVSIERAQAKAAYEETVHRRVDPALAEWSSGRSFRFRVYPIPANGTKAVRIAYDEELTSAPYTLDLRYGVTVKQLDVVIDAGNVRVESTLPLARGGDGWSLHLTNARCDGTIRIDRDPLEVAVASFSPADGFWYVSAPLRVAPASRAIEPSSQVVLLWDASGSAAERDDARVRAFLRAFAAKQIEPVRISLIPFAIDVEDSHDVTLETALTETRSGGATNLAGMLEKLPQLAAAGDARLVLVTDGVSTLGDRARLTRAIASLARLRRPIAVVTASASADDALLQSIAAATGGWTFDLTRTEPDAAAATAMQLPARVTIAAASTRLRDVLPAAAVSAGEQSIVANARSSDRIVSLPIAVDGEVRDIPVREVRDAGDLVRRAWARARLRQLLDGGARDEAVVEHGQRFNQLTPRTSLLILESWQDYVMYDIPLPDDLREQKNIDERQLRDEMRAHQEQVKEILASWVTLPPADAKWFVKGHVTYSNGEPLPGVQVLFTSPNVGALVTLTNANGDYWIAAAAVPSSVTIRAELTGFSEAVRSYPGGVPKGATVDLVLSGAVMESITVTGSGPATPDESGESAGSRGASLAAPTPEALADRLLQALAANEPLPEDEELAAASLQKRHAVIAEVIAKLRSIRSVEERYRYYVLARSVLGGEKLFHVTAAEAFREDALPLAVRILTDLAEAYPDDAPLLRILGRVVDGWGRPDVARLLFERALELSPREPQTWRELILLESRLRNTKGVEAWAARFAAARRDPRMREVDELIDHELPRARAATGDARIDPASGLQVELMFDTNYSYVDIHIVEAAGEEVTWDHDRSANGGLMTGWLTEGFGPEVYVNRGGIAGDYRIDLQYYSSDGSGVSRETLSHVIVYNGGQRHDYLAVLQIDNERRTIATVRAR